MLAGLGGGEVPLDGRPLTLRPASQAATSPATGNRSPLQRARLVGPASRAGGGAPANRALMFRADKPAIRMPRQRRPFARSPIVSTSCGPPAPARHGLSSRGRNWVERRIGKPHRSTCGLSSTSSARGCRPRSPRGDCGNRFSLTTGWLGGAARRRSVDARVRHRSVGSSGNTHVRACDGGRHT